VNAASTLVTLRGDNAKYGMDPAAMVARYGTSAERIVDGLLRDLVDGDVASSVRNGLLAYATTGYTGKPEEFTKDAQRTDRTVRSVAHLIMSTPIFQMA
jgi:hypothetical protein